MNHPTLDPKKDWTPLHNVHDVAQGYKKLLVSNLSYLLIKARDDLKEMVVKKSFLALTFLLLLLAWVSGAASLAAYLSTDWGYPKAILAVCLGHVGLALFSFFVSLGLERRARLAPRPEPVEWMDPEAQRLLSEIKEHEQEVDDARQELEKSLKPSEIVKRKADIVLPAVFFMSLWLGFKRRSRSA